MLTLLYHPLSSFCHKVIIGLYELEVPHDKRIVNLGDEGFSVERLAAEVAQSRGNLHRRLRDLIGESPSDLIRRIRLERASELLASGAGSVAEIAYAVGFKSVAHFSNAFNEQTGVRPSAWREHSATKAAHASSSEMVSRSFTATDLSRPGWVARLAMAVQLLSIRARKQP